MHSSVYVAHAICSVCRRVCVRCRDRGVTMLVRVDICASDAGVLVVSVSHHTGGFAPYRLDNCSPETLHLRCACGLLGERHIRHPFEHLFPLC